MVYPIIENIHVLAIALLAGTVAIVDLRLLSAVNTVVDVHTRVSDLYSSPYSQIGEQLVDHRDRQRGPGERTHQQQRIQHAGERPAGAEDQDASGSSTPDDLGELLPKVWKEPGFLTRESRGHCCVRARVHAPWPVASNDFAVRIAIPDLARCPANPNR